MPARIDGHKLGAKGMDETLVQVMLECKRYEREQSDMMRLFLNELGREINVVGGSRKDCL